MQLDISKNTLIIAVNLQKYLLSELYSSGNANLISSFRHQNEFGKHMFNINFQEYEIFYYPIFNIFIETNKDPNNESIEHIN